MTRPSEELGLPLAARPLARALAAAVALLALLGLGALLLVHLAGWAPSRHLVQLLLLDVEHNVPTLFQGVLLAACGALLLLVARVVAERGGPFVGHWRLLGAIFFLLALDEVLRLHERTIAPLREGLGTSGALHFAWVLPAAVLLVVLGIAYLRWLAALPPRFRRLALVAAALYVGGALVMEMVGGILAGGGREGTLAYGLMTTVEETGEMAGLALFLVALVDHLASLVPAVRLPLRGLDGR